MLALATVLLFSALKFLSFYNDNWMTCPRPASGNMCGNRGILFEDDLLESEYRDLVDGNRFAFMGEAIDDGAQSGISVRTPANLVRRNVLYLNAATGLNFYTDGTGTYEARGDQHVDLGHRLELDRGPGRGVGLHRYGSRRGGLRIRCRRGRARSADDASGAVSGGVTVDGSPAAPGPM